jgi:hypothetical protein
MVGSASRVEPSQGQHREARSAVGCLFWYLCDVSEAPDVQVEVLSGRAEQGLTWVIRAGGTDDHFMTMLHVSRGERMVAGSGMGGPKLWGEDIMNEYRGRSDDLPYFVMVRTAAVVDRVIATTDRGTEVELALSPVIAQFGLKFGAAALPAGEGPGTIRAEVDGHIQQLSPQSFPGRPAPPS